MTRVTSPTEGYRAVDARTARTHDAETLSPSPAAVGALRQELADLQREVVGLRVQHQRDLATARGLGEALQALRRGAMALRTENEDLRRQLSGRSPRRR